MRDNAFQNSFSATRWSLVVRATDSNDSTRRAAISELLQTYYQPMKSYLLKRGIGQQDAEDCLQDFVLGKFMSGFLEREWKPNQQFRAFLKHCLKNFLNSHYRHKNREANRPNLGVGFEPDQLNNLKQSGDSADMALDTEWAKRVIELALQRTNDEVIEAGNAERWQIFLERFLRPTLTQCEPTSYGVLVELYGFESQRQVENVLINEKRRFSRVLMSVIGEYAGNVDAAEDELRDLKRVVAAARNLDVRIPGELSHIAIRDESLSVVMDTATPELFSLRENSAADQLDAIVRHRVADFVRDTSQDRTTQLGELFAARSPSVTQLDEVRRFAERNDPPKA